MVAPRVACVGVVVADLFVPPLPAVPGAGELVATDDFLLQPGGCAANAAVALARLDVSASVTGKLGDDIFADFLERDLTATGIDVRGLRRSSRHGTSKTVVLSVAGEDRRFIHTFGANADLVAADLDAALASAADVLYVGGYLALPGLARGDVADWCRLARSSGARTVLDVVVPEGAEISLDSLREVLPHVDFFLPNRDEAEALTAESDPARQAELLLEAGARHVVITMGEEGALTASAEGSLRLPAPRIEVVDPSGAGDAFAAGLIVGLLEGWTTARTLEFASVIGASACTALGCTAGVFTRAQADAHLRSHPLEARAATSRSG